MPLCRGDFFARGGERLRTSGAPGTSLGEAGCVGSLPAVMLAIMNAFEPLGVREFDMPATSERVWQAIQRAGTQVLAAPRPGVQL